MNTAILVLWLSGSMFGGRATPNGGITTQQVVSMDLCQRVVQQTIAYSKGSVNGTCIAFKETK